MSIDVNDLPVWAQKQIAQKLQAQEAKKRAINRKTSDKGEMHTNGEKSRRNGTNDGQGKLSSETQKPNTSQKTGVTQCGKGECITYIVHGDPRTKKNHMMIAGSGERCPTCGKPKKQFIKQSASHDKWAKDAKKELVPIPEKPIDTPVNVQVHFYMQTRRRVDGLNLLASVDDLLTEAGILEDDNAKIVVGHDGSRVFYDKENPRMEITITPEVSK